MAEFLDKIYFTVTLARVDQTNAGSQESLNKNKVHHVLDFPFLNGVKTLNASLLRGKWLLTWEHNSIKCKSFSAYKQNYCCH